MSAFKKTKITFAITSLLSTSLYALDGSDGPGFDNTARPAGTYLKFVDRGGRMMQYHRGYMYIMGQGKTTLWDVSDATNPVIVDEKDYGDNGHRWWKLNTDMFWREYSNPEIAGSGYHFVDQSNMLDLKPWTDPNVPVPIEEVGVAFQHQWQSIETFPLGTNGGNAHDLRYNQPDQTALMQDTLTSTFDGADGNQRFRIGNIMFIAASGGVQTFDIGDPENIRFLDHLGDESTHAQYTTTVHVWRDQMAFMSGSDDNIGGNNLVTIDFSDPANLKEGKVRLPVSEASSGRYMYFQDEYGFMGQGNLGVKINMETGEVAQKFISPEWPQTFLDYQWMPFGPVIVATGSDGGNGRTAFMQHQDGPDNKGPEIGFHHPFADSTGNPISSVIGFSIAEMIDERTATDKTIQISPVGGEPIEGDITWSSYQVLNFIPKKMLKPDVTYEVKFVEGGLKDITGNGVDEYKFFFSTGNALTSPAKLKVNTLSLSETTTIEVGDRFTLSADLSYEGNGKLSYEWEFSDGSIKTGSDPEISHQFSSSGLYEVKLKVTDDNGSSALFVRNVVVAGNHDMGTAPSQSSQLALHKTSNRLLVVNPDNNSLSILNASTLNKVDEVAVCQDPISITLDNKGLAWLVCRDDDLVQIIDPVTGANLGTIALEYGSQANAIIASPSGEHIYVAESGSGKVSKFDSANKRFIDSIELGIHARAMAITGDGKTLMVTQFISDQENARIWQIALTDFSLKTQYNLAEDTETPDSGSIGGGLPNYLSGIAIKPGYDEAMAIAKKDNVDRGLARDGNPLTFETTVRTAILPINLATNSADMSERFDIDDHGQPSAVIYSPLGTHLFIAMQGNNRVIVIDPNTQREIARFDTELAPQALLIDPDTNVLYVKNFTSRSVSSYDVSGMLTMGSNEVALIKTTKTVVNETLDPLVLKGKQVFYNAADKRMALDGYMSCASCHLDGDQDGRVWDFTDRGEGLRNTISLKGRAGMGHGRVHWSGNFDEIQDFENDIRNGFSGKGFLSNADFSVSMHTLGLKKAGLNSELDALSAYVTSLGQFDKSPHRSANGQLTTEARLGKQVFEQANCGSCHTGEAMTDSATGLAHDINSMSSNSGQRLSTPLLGIDTPTLRDVWATAPYFHDGSAAQLSDVLIAGHGLSGQLSSTEKSQLVAYLEQIDGSEAAPFNQPVNLYLSSFSDGEIFSQNDSVPLSIHTNLKQIASVSYYAGGNLVASSTTAPYNAMWLPSSNGRYLLQAKVTYNNGLTATVSPERAIEYGQSLVGDGGSAKDIACSANYVIEQNWGQGLMSYVEITNTGSDDIVGYRVSWSIGDNETFMDGWNADYSDSDGQHISGYVAPLKSHGVIEPNETHHINLRLDFTGEPHVPNDFAVDGVPCEGSVVNEPEIKAQTIIADFSHSVSNDTVQVNANLSSTTGDKSLSYTWSFGDGSLPVSGTQATHSYVHSGQYTITVVVTDGVSESKESQIVSVIGQGIDEVDSDNDGINDDLDNCINKANAEQDDLDGDGLGNACDDDIDGDQCPNSAELEGGSDVWDEADNICLISVNDDQDKDGVLDAIDNCPGISNSGQWDNDNDGLGNVCDDDVDGDGCSNDDEIRLGSGVWNAQDNLCSDGHTVDTDKDGVLDTQDNCPTIANPQQWDRDKDGIGNDCDNDIDGDGCANIDEPLALWNINVNGCLSTGILDQDGDGVSDDKDNCPTIANSGQWDKDRDGLGNECDNDIDGDECSNADEISLGSSEWNAASNACSVQADNDMDGIADAVDNCPKVANPGQWDKDKDNIGNECDSDLDGDNCSNEFELANGSNPWQGNSNACINSGNGGNDKDGDGISDDADNCPNIANLNQWDKDKDNIGNDCDFDIDGDGVSNVEELAAGTLMWDPTSF